MTASAVQAPSQPIPMPVKKKRVLLVDTSRKKRDVRADAMRNLGMDVDCAADITEARSWWRADLYNLVLISVNDGAGHCDKFCADVRSATPPQQLAFLVGKPGYLAEAPNADLAPASATDDNPALLADVRETLAAFGADGAPQRWGILEACQRISAVRSVSDARSRALRNRPTPPRDLEVRLNRKGDQFRTLDDLLREELQ